MSTKERQHWKALCRCIVLEGLRFVASGCGVFRSGEFKFGGQSVSILRVFGLGWKSLQYSAIVGARTMCTHRLHSSSFLGLPYSILNMNPKKELLCSPRVLTQGVRSTFLGDTST